MSATGTLLGIDECADWEDQAISITENSRLAISTDGITETCDADEKQFGKQRLLDMLLESATLSAKHTADLIQKRVIEFRGDQTQADDVTLLLIDFDSKTADTNGMSTNSLNAAGDLTTEPVE